MSENPSLKVLIADMANTLEKFEKYAWEGDPKRREDDQLCTDAVILIAVAKKMLEEL